MQLQWYDEAALVRDGKIMHVLSAAGSRGVLPQLRCVSPVALHTAAPERLLLTGQNLAVVDNRVLARCQGEQTQPGIWLCLQIFLISQQPLLSKHADIAEFCLVMGLVCNTVV